METSKWEGTKEPVTIEFCEDEAGYFFYEITSPPFETKKQAESNARLFTDALHTIQECGMMPSELLEFTKSLGVDLSNEVNRNMDLHGHSMSDYNQLREENAKLKAGIFKAISILESDGTDWKTEDEVIDELKKLL